MPSSFAIRWKVPPASLPTMPLSRHQRRRRQPRASHADALRSVHAARRPGRERPPAEHSFAQDLNVVVWGDLRHGRTVHSLVYALARLKARIIPAPPPAASCPTHVGLRLQRDYHCIPLTKDNVNKRLAARCGRRLSHARRAASARLVRRAINERKSRALRRSMPSIPRGSSSNASARVMRANIPRSIQISQAQALSRHERDASAAARR